LSISVAKFIPNQDLTINFGTAEPRFMRIWSVCLELLHVDTHTHTHNKTASSQTTTTLA